MTFKRKDFKHFAHVGRPAKPHYYTTPIGKFELPDWITNLENYYKFDVVFSVASDASCHPNYICNRAIDGSFVGGYAGGREFWIAKNIETLKGMLKRYRAAYPDKHLGVVKLKREKKDMQ